MLLSLKIYLNFISIQWSIQKLQHETTDKWMENQRIDCNRKYIKHVLRKR